MKKLLIAGYVDSTVNYQNAFARLGVSFDTLPPRIPRPMPFPDHSVPPVSLPRLSYCPWDYDGLVLPGGGDIAPALFGAVNQGSRDIDEQLDCLQLRTLAAFIQAEKPVLGICKGLQIINVHFGGTILQDLPEHSQLVHAYVSPKESTLSRKDMQQEAPTPCGIPIIRKNGDKIHPTKAAGGTFPERLYGNAPITNSAHHQGVGTVGDGLLVAQYSHDFVIEAMYHEQLPILGVQWHPERMCFEFADPRMEDGAKLLRYFLSLL